MKCLRKGALVLSAAERKALDAEIRRQALEQFDQMALAMDVLLAKSLHDNFGFGESRVKKAMVGMGEARKEFREIYSTDITDDTYIYGIINDLKRAGIDVEAMHQQAKVYFNKE